jgi:NADPH-dependent curcumin reductase CurA
MKEPEINLNGWLTIARAADQAGVTTNVISNWIKRGKIQYREFPELNGLRLVPGEFFKPKA